MIDLESMFEGYKKRPQYQANAEVRAAIDAAEAEALAKKGNLPELNKVIDGLKMTLVKILAKKEEPKSPPPAKIEAVQELPKNIDRKIENIIMKNLPEEKMWEVYEAMKRQWNEHFRKAFSNALAEFKKKHPESFKESVEEYEKNTWEEKYPQFEVAMKDIQDEPWTPLTKFIALSSVLFNSGTHFGGWHNDDTKKLFDTIEGLFANFINDHLPENLKKRLKNQEFSVCAKNGRWGLQFYNQEDSTASPRIILTESEAIALPNAFGYRYLDLYPSGETVARFRFKDRDQRGFFDGKRLMSLSEHSLKKYPEIAGSFKSCVSAPMEISNAVAIRLANKSCLIVNGFLFLLEEKERDAIDSETKFSSEGLQVGDTLIKPYGFFEESDISIDESGISTFEESVFIRYDTTKEKEEKQSLQLHIEGGEIKNLEEQYKNRLKTLSTFGIVEDENAPAIEAVNGIQYPMPTLDEIQSAITEEHFWKIRDLKSPVLLIVPFGLNLGTIFEKICVPGHALQQGSVNPENIAMEQLHHDGKKSLAKMMEGCRYFPKNLQNEKNGSMKKQEVLETQGGINRFPGWQVVVVEGYDNPWPEKDNEETTLNDELQKLRKEGFSGLTDEDWMMLHAEGVLRGRPFDTYNKYDGRNEINPLLGSYYPPENYVPGLVWHVGERRVKIKPYENPSTRKEKNVGVRKAVRIL